MEKKKNLHDLSPIIVIVKLGYNSSKVVVVTFKAWHGLPPGKFWHTHTCTHEYHTLFGYGCGFSWVTCGFLIIFLKYIYIYIYLYNNYTSTTKKQTRGSQRICVASPCPSHHPLPLLSPSPALPLAPQYHCCGLGPWVGAWWSSAVGGGGDVCMYM